MSRPLKPTLRPVPERRPLAPHARCHSSSLAVHGFGLSRPSLHEPKKRVVSKALLILYGHTDTALGTAHWAALSTARGSLSPNEKLYLIADKLVAVGAARCLFTCRNTMSSAVGGSTPDPQPPALHTIRGFASGCLRELTYRVIDCMTGLHRFTGAESLDATIHSTHFPLLRQRQCTDIRASLGIIRTRLPLPPPLPDWSRQPHAGDRLNATSTSTIMWVDARLRWSVLPIRPCRDWMDVCNACGRRELASDCCAIFMCELIPAQPEEALALGATLARQLDASERLSASQKWETRIGSSLNATPVHEVGNTSYSLPAANRALYLSLSAFKIRSMIVV
ncbi:hypothetical protein Purlil1_6429 [Purpureocillium lilacinum]|uniref:Uncharacterized protein n=1 Tax=Purpureocillium lilacinum TaxID=33203 RepID=A0ABR0BYY7_PURLI|nr:hypothetical protein Purlil1_6429 [Purpureocillium lilacinum]